MKCYQRTATRRKRLLLWIVFGCLTHLACAQELGIVRLSMEKQDASIEEILNDIRVQAGIKIFYNAQLVRNVCTSVSIEDEPLEKALEKIFQHTPLTYVIENGTIVIAKRKQQQATGKEKEIFGIVKDEEDNPLPGATVRIGNTDRGTITNANGAFKMHIPAETQTLTISYIGMESQIVRIGRNEAFTIVLREDNQQLADVVITGYQKISKERATGAFSIVKPETIEERHVTNISQVLDGLVAGMQGSDDGRGGKSFSIRGIGTMQGDQKPLVVVDGFPITDVANNGSSELNAFQKINPNDVESITVLKDAAAASIWGARSANGVIVITTKRGSRRERLNVEVNAQLSVVNKMNVDQITNTANSADFIAYERMAFENGWTSGEFSGASNELQYPVTLAQSILYKGMRFGTLTTDEMERQLSALALLDNREQIKEYLLKRQLQSQVNISITGGTQHNSTYASMMFTNDTGRLAGERSNTYFLNFNNQYRFNSRVTLHLGANFQHRNEHSAGLSTSDIATLSPYEMLLNPDGSYATQVNKYNTELLQSYPWQQFSYDSMNYNLLQEVRSRKYNTKHTLFRGQAGLDIKLMEGLNFNSKFQYEENRYDTENYNAPSSFYVRDVVNFYTPYDLETGTVGTSAIPKGGILMSGKGKTTATVFRNDLSFDRTFGGRHAVSVIVGNELSNYKTTTHSNPHLYGYSPDSRTSSPLAASKAVTLEGWEVSIPGTKANMTWNNNRYVSFYGNASYTLDEKYGLSVSARSDASNLITSKPRYRWSPLWSAGLLWNLERESFLSNCLWVNRLALRLTYGQNGNTSTSSSARTTIGMNSSNLDEGTGLNPGYIADYGNPTLRWEKTATTNVGLDFALLGNRLFGSVDFYNKKGTDILGNVNIAGVHGTHSVIFNNAELLNRGVELSLGTSIDLRSIDLNFSGTLSYAYNHNKVTSLYQEHHTVMDLIGSSYIEGLPMYPLYAFEYLGMKEGVPYVSDGNGGEIRIDDYSLMYGEESGALKYMGSMLSPHTLGLSLNLRWKALSLSALFNGRFGGKMRMPIFNYPVVEGWSKTRVNAQLADVLAGSNAVPALPQPYDYGYGIWSTYLSYLDTQVESASYIYCQEVVANFTLPHKTLRGIGIKEASIFGKLENLGLLWSANSKHYHPEYLPGVADPALTCSFGVRINL